MEISDEKLELFAGMEPIDAVDKTVKSMASDLLSTRADLAAAREELERYKKFVPVETAPKDGSYILLLEKGEINKAAWLGDYVNYPGSKPIKRWCVYGSWQDEQGGHEVVDEPEGWMPLPLPPKDGEG